MNPIQKAYLQIHVAIFFWGFTAILGDLISLNATVLVWWRVLITSISLLFLINVGELVRRLPRKILLKFCGIGVLIALHWITFFGSIKLANASIALICMATTSLFTSFMEPILTGRPFKWYEVVLSLFIIPGMWLIVDSTEVSMKMGIWVGLTSAFLVSLFSIFTKELVHHANAYEITFMQIGTAWLFISLILPFYFYYEPSTIFLPVGMDWPYLLVLALLCTTFAYSLSLKAYNHLSAFAVNLTVNLEPVYGIAMAYFLLNDADELSPNFYWGVLIIIATVFSYPLFRKLFEKKVES